MKNSCSRSLQLFYRDREIEGIEKLNFGLKRVNYKFGIIQAIIVFRIMSNIYNGVFCENSLRPLLDGVLNTYMLPINQLLLLLTLKMYLLVGKQE